MTTAQFTYKICPSELHETMLAADFPRGCEAEIDVEFTPVDAVPRSWDYPGDPAHIENVNVANVWTLEGYDECRGDGRMYQHDATMKEGATVADLFDRRFDSDAAFRQAVCDSCLTAISEQA